MKSPILNSPYLEPNRHFKADERGLTDEIVESRRPSSFYIPVPKAKTKQKQLELKVTATRRSEIDNTRIEPRK